MEDLKPMLFTCLKKYSKEQFIKDLIAGGVLDLQIDMSRTIYISSVGLRVILATKKSLDAKKGKLVLKQVCPQVKEIFDVTGFSGFLMMED